MQVVVAALIVGLLGVIFCFFGYRVFLVMLPIWGFFAGFWIGAQGVALVFGQGFLATVTGWAFGFVLGLIGAVLAYLFYYVGVAIVGAGFGAAVGSGLMAALGFETGFLNGLVAVVFAVVVAGLVLLLNLQKYVIIAMTAIGGANALILGALLLMGRIPLENVQTAANAVRPVLQDSWFWLIVWIVLAIAGGVAQLRANREYTFSRTRYVEGWG